ncbi:MAG: glycosyltransferase family 39 protein [Candidatus Omnitrophota bacterium]
MMIFGMKTKFLREAILIIFAAMIAWLIITSFSSIVFLPGADEGCYLRYTKEVLDKGLPAFKDLLVTYIADSNYWGFPVPVRCGFIICGAFFCRLFGFSFISIAFLSLFSFFCAVFFTYWLSRKVFGRDVAFLAGLFFLSSPLALALSRRALSDSASNFLLLTAVLWQIDYFTSGCRRWKKWSLAAVLLLALAFRETNILFIFPLAVSSLAFLPEKGFRQLIKSWVVIYAVPVGAIFIIYKFLFGNIADIFKALFFLPSAGSHSYVLQFQSGPWFRYLIDFILVSPWVMILGIYYILYVLIHKTKKEDLALALFIIFTIFTFSFFSKNLRYVSVIDYPLRIFTAMAILSVHSVRSKYSAFTFALAVVMLICVMELVNFIRIFVWAGVYDPVSFGLLSFWNIIPHFN